MKSVNIGKFLDIYHLTLALVMNRGVLLPRQGNVNTYRTRAMNSTTAGVKNGVKTLQDLVPSLFQFNVHTLVQNNQNLSNPCERTISKTPLQMTVFKHTSI